MTSRPSRISSAVPNDTLALIQRGLRVCELFCDWPDLVIDRLAVAARLAHHARGTPVRALFHKEREVKVVVSGAIAVSGVNMQGGKFTLLHIGPGELVGLVRLLDQGERLYDYHAHRDSVVIHLPSEDLVSILNQTPLLWRNVALMALRRQRDSIVAMRHRALDGLQQTVAQTLMRMANLRGVREGVDGSLRLDLSQDDLAHIVSVSRQTINKELRLLAQRGLLRVAYGRVHLLDMTELQRIAEMR